MDKKKNMGKTGMSVAFVVAGVAFIFIIVSILFNIQWFDDFDSSKYVNAVCLQMLQGDVETVVEMTEGLNEEDAKKQYEEMVNYFLENVIASGLTLEGKEKKECVKISKKIFSKLKYEVKEEKKVKDGKYVVTIEYQKTDVIQRIQELAKKEYELVYEKVDKGDHEYRGTEEEVYEQIQSDIAKKLPEILEEACKSMKFEKKETMTITVKKDENGLYKADISQFLIKIMDLKTKEH